MTAAERVLICEIGRTLLTIGAPSTGKVALVVAIQNVEEEQKKGLKQ